MESIIRRIITDFSIALGWGRSFAESRILVERNHYMADPGFFTAKLTRGIDSTGVSCIDAMFFPDGRLIFDVSGNGHYGIFERLDTYIVEDSQVEDRTDAIVNDLIGVAVKVRREVTALNERLAA